MSAPADCYHCGEPVPDGIYVVVLQTRVPSGGPGRRSRCLVVVR